jgi:hypothetical protein
VYMRCLSSDSSLLFVATMERTVSCRPREPFFLGLPSVSDRGSGLRHWVMAEVGVEETGQEDNLPDSVFVRESRN